MADHDEAFTAYVSDHRRRLVRVAFLLCGSWAQAEDVTQISLAKLYLAWPRIRRTDDPDVYARTVVARTVIDESRRAWRRELPTATELPDQTTTETEPASDLRSALLRLPLRQRQTVVLRHYWGMSVAETADQLGISTGSVKSHCSRALLRLNELLAPLAETSTGKGTDR